MPAEDKRLLLTSCAIVFLTTASLFLYQPQLANSLLEAGGSSLLPASTPEHTRHQFYAVAMSLPQVCAALGAPVLGAMSDRWGSKPILLLAIAGALGAMLLCAASTLLAFPLLLLAGLATIGFMDGSGVILQAGLTEGRSPDVQASHINLLAACSILGIVAGPLLGGLLASAGAAAPFVVTAGLFAITLAATALLYRGTLRPARKTREAAGSWYSEFANVLRPPQVRRHLALFCLMEIALACFYERLPMLLAALHASAPLIGLFGACTGLVMVVTCSILVPAFPARWGSNSVLAGAFLAILAAGALLGGRPSMLPVWLAAAPFAAGAATIYCVAMGKMTESVGAREQGKIAGLATWVSGCAFAVAGMLVSGSSTALGWQFPVLLGAAALGGIVVALWRGLARRPHALQEQLSISSNDEV